MFQKKQGWVERLDFVLAGAQKSGTTALHHFLSRHPRITMGDRQEIHFFDNDAFFVSEPDYAELHKHYPLRAGAIIAGDCTPSYLYHQPVAERIWKYNPAIKFLVLLRNPVERAFAHWNMQRYRGREPLDFLDAVHEEKKRMAAAPPAEARRFAYVARGFYAAQLERLFTFFPRDQVKVIKFEEFRDKQRETLGTIFAFLGLKPLRFIRGKDRNVVPYERGITAAERERLYEIFAPDIARLERMLGWNCSDWKL